MSCHIYTRDFTNIFSVFLQDQVEKMKAINAHLCSRVNRHEDKLLNITDELNKTWTFVSTLKQQHRQLHESEQILRAELTEKRHILGIVSHKIIKCHQ